MVYRCEVGWFPLDRLALSSPSKARVVLAMNRAWQRIQPRSHGRSKLRSVIQWLFNGWLVVLTCFNHQPHGNFMKFSGISWWSNVECWFTVVMLYNRGFIELFGFGFSLYIEWLMSPVVIPLETPHFSQPPGVPWRNWWLGWIYPWFFLMVVWRNGVSLNHPRLDCFGLNKPNTAGVPPIL